MQCRNLVHKGKKEKDKVKWCKNGLMANKSRHIRIRQIESGKIHLCSQEICLYVGHWMI